MNIRWRVTELSAILLVLLDSRCPPLHIPPALYSYITNLKPARQIIFVLTKIGVVGDECAKKWKVWLEARYPGTQCVYSESYRRKAGDEERKGQGMLGSWLLLQTERLILGIRLKKAPRTVYSR